MPGTERERLTAGLRPHEQRIHARLLASMLEGNLDQPLHERLRGWVEKRRARVQELRDSRASFGLACATAAAADDRARVLLDHARLLGADPGRLRGDERALDRYLGRDCIEERYSKRLGEAERALAFGLDRLAAACAQWLEENVPGRDARALWRSLDLEKTLRPSLEHSGDSRVRVAAFRCLATALSALPAQAQESAVEDRMLQFVYRAALDPGLDVWIQCEALQLLSTLSPESLEQVLARRLTQPASGDDLFVRRRAVGLLGAGLAPGSEGFRAAASRFPGGAPNLGAGAYSPRPRPLCGLARRPGLRELLPFVRRDPSPHVRQGLAAALLEEGGEAAREHLPALLSQDESRHVRAAAALAAGSLLPREGWPELALDWLLGRLREETDEFVVRVLVHATAAGMENLIRSRGPQPGLSRRVQEALADLHASAARLPVRRAAAAAHERLWAGSAPRTAELTRALSDLSRRIEPSASGRLPGQALEQDEETLGRVLSVLAQDDFGFDVREGRLRRGHKLGFRFWRFWHEWIHPSPDKRQAFSHTVGRIFDGELRVPSSILAELTETKVPGEPLFMPTEDGWRPYLPLVDEALSCAGGLLGRRVRIYTSEGVTELAAPAGPLGRLRAALRLTGSFASYARLRNWREADQQDPGAYVAALRELGFEVTYRPHPMDDLSRLTADPGVLRFFPAAAPGALGGHLSGLREHFVSQYSNTLSDLALFSMLATAFFLGRHVWVNQRLRAARRRLPLVVGGWGTRGKSGTERLKAAVFNALGYSVVSKTTGCEAMFLYSYPFGSLREMFLYRPYDKATIWEQHDVARLGERLGADVFLWECMALNPSYVQILQKQWMRDDLSTITNTYPDHEDIQGPAGIDIPQVMVNFIPDRSSLLTSEEQMLPILSHGAREAGTVVTPVGWIEAGLLAPDVLSRFPYAEHPSNIALVLAMAEHLGIDRDFALKEMADRVVPDLGVLKVYPLARVQGRSLDFSNGMSANERRASVENWTRLGFDRQDAVNEPGTWVTTVVNNRADRIPRSKVFAAVIVNDMSADRHFLIGSNLGGLLSYVREAWDEKMARLSLFAAGATPARVLEEQARWLRLPITEAEAQARAEVMRRPGLEPYCAEADRHATELTGWISEYRALAARIGSGAASRETLDAELKELLWRWYSKKLIVVWDYHASGEQIVRRIVEETPPGVYNRVMGIQNIKGPGLDFVYRWQAWEKCQRACQKLSSVSPREADDGLGELMTFQEFGQLGEETVRVALASARERPGAQREGFLAGLKVIESQLENRMREIRASLESTGGQGWADSLFAHIEGFLDAGDAVTRRKQANRIYEDLVEERIGLERAAVELQTLMKRQKGGWVASAVKRFLARLRRR